MAGYMTPEEQQGVLITIGTMANTIHVLQEAVERAQARIAELESEKIYNTPGGRDGTFHDQAASTSDT